MAYIQSLPFNEETPAKLSSMAYGSSWPVVYILNNDSEAYVGETLDAVIRSRQHLDNPERKKLTQMSIITDDTFNKSVILDLEAYLIKHMGADNVYSLQNNNDGLKNHEYFNRNIYAKRFEDIWEQLRQRKLAHKTARDIENSDLFKYSPYNALSSDQYLTVSEIIHELAATCKSGKDMHSLVCGGPGTGKTILGVYLMKLLHDRNVNEIPEELNEDINSRLLKDLISLPDLKIGFVVPMGSLRSTMTNIFSSVHGLTKDMIISPTGVVKKKYDLLIVDEAHRLKRRKALQQNYYHVMDENNKSFGLGPEGTELDWILKSSKYQIIFYDDRQTVRPCDVLPEKFNELKKDKDTIQFLLRTQFRCKGGDEYIRYMRDIFSAYPPADFRIFDGYDLKLFDDGVDMINAIKEKNKDMKLCRVIAGYGWEWKSRKNPEAYDIKIGNEEYRWNTTDKDWINSPNSIDEIGCIHTVQGYDLNYAGVILGPEIDYVEGRFVVDPKKYYDMIGKNSISQDQDKLVDFINNIYSTMLTRGICGTYIYACNSGLRQYLKKYIRTEPHIIDDGVKAEPQIPMIDNEIAFPTIGKYQGLRVAEKPDTDGFEQ